MHIHSATREGFRPPGGVGERRRNSLHLIQNSDIRSRNLRQQLRTWACIFNIRLITCHPSLDPFRQKQSTIEEPSRNSLAGRKMDRNIRHQRNISKFRRCTKTYLLRVAGQSSQGLRYSLRLLLFTCLNGRLYLREVLLMEGKNCARV